MTTLHHRAIQCTNTIMAAYTADHEPPSAGDTTLMTAMAWDIAQRFVQYSNPRYVLNEQCSALYREVMYDTLDRETKMSIQIATNHHFVFSSAITEREQHSDVAFLTVLLWLSSTNQVIPLVDMLRRMTNDYIQVTEGKMIFSSQLLKLHRAWQRLTLSAVYEVLTQQSDHETPWSWQSPLRAADVLRQIQHHGLREQEWQQLTNILGKQFRRESESAWQI